MEFEGLTGPVRYTDRKRTDYTIDVYSLSFKQKMKKVIYKRYIFKIFKASVSFSSTDV